MEFRLLRPEEALHLWPDLSRVLSEAIEQCRGEVQVDDLRELILCARMFVFGGFVDGNLVFATTAEFHFYPRKRILLVGFGAGSTEGQLDEVIRVLSEFGRSGGATTMQTFCKNPAMVRYHQQKLNAEFAYTVLEKPL